MYLCTCTDKCWKPCFPKKLLRFTLPDLFWPLFCCMVRHPASLWGSAGLWSISLNTKGKQFTHSYWPEDLWILWTHFQKQLWTYLLCLAVFSWLCCYLSQGTNKRVRVRIRTTVWNPDKVLDPDKGIRYVVNSTLRDVRNETTQVVGGIYCRHTEHRDSSTQYSFFTVEPQSQTVLTLTV